MPDETAPISRLNKCCVAAVLHSVRYTMVLSPAHRAGLGAGLFDGGRRTQPCIAAACSRRCCCVLRMQ